MIRVHTNINSQEVVVLDDLEAVQYPRIEKAQSSLYFNYKGNDYLDIQRRGFAAQFCFPFAKSVCKGQGVDVGCMKIEWAFEGAVPIDLSFDNGYHATNLPKNESDADGKWDYIIASHLLEHVNDWTGVLNYWWENIKDGGVIFLYLPDYSSVYWRTWENRKHINNLRPEELKDYFEFKGAEKVFTTGIDLYNSFTVIAIK